MDWTSMRGNVAFVTGGASGIGRATARAFLDLGVHVAIADFNEAALVTTVGELEAIGPQVLPIHADLSVAEELGAIFQRAVTKLGRVDYLVNCAATLTATQNLFEVNTLEWDRVMQINLRTPMFLMQAFAKHAVERGGGGRIVFVSSSAAFRAQRNRPAYGSSKGGLTSLVRIAAAQLGAHDINVNAVAPGTTNTPTTTTARNVDVSVLKQRVSEGPGANFFKRLSEPEDIAAPIVFLCSPGSRQITGQTIQVSAGEITP